jgi:hypothetical protein
VLDRDWNARVETSLIAGEVGTIKFKNEHDMVMFSLRWSCEAVMTYKVSVPYDGSRQWRDLQIWLLDNIPDYDCYRITGLDYDNMNNRLVEFQYEHHAILFALRWS